MGSLSLVVPEKGGGMSTPLAPAIFQVLLAQNNPHAKVAYLGVAYSVTLPVYFPHQIGIHMERQDERLSGPFTCQPSH